MDSQQGITYLLVVYLMLSRKRATRLHGFIPVLVEHNPPERKRIYYGHFRMKPDKIFQTDNRILISTVTQLRTGHGYFNSYLSKIPTSDVEDRGCSCNGAPPQTPAHLILRSPTPSTTTPTT